MENESTVNLEKHIEKVPVVSFLSGKGGVGKTTFAVNFARILSSCSKVLLIDCDLANRGATSLLSPDVKKGETNLYALLRVGLRGGYLFSLDARLEEGINKSILSEELKNAFKTNVFPLPDTATVTKVKENEWVITDEEKFIVRKEDGKLNIYRGESSNEKAFLRIIESHELKKLHENLYFLPSTSTRELVEWIEYEVEIERLKDVTSNIINVFVERYGIQCVILDCKPGPDPMSGAVSALSTFSILITEADPVTYSGTLNLRFYLSERYGVKENIYVIVNKVPEKYNIENLDSYYKDKVTGILQIFNVLSYVPFEYEIFESFGEKEFVIDSFPHSVFAKKIAVLAADLFKDGFPDLISPDIKGISERETKKIRRTIKPELESKRLFLYQTISAISIIGGLLLILIPMFRDINFMVVIGVAYIAIGILFGFYYIQFRSRYIRRR